MKETRFRLIVHYPTLSLIWHVKFGTYLTEAKVDGFEASEFGLTIGVTNVPSIQVDMPSQQLLPLSFHIP